MTISQPFNVVIQTLGGTAHITWTPPTTYDDGSTPLTVVSYVIYASQNDPVGADYSTEIPAPANSYDWYHTDFNQTETWYFWVTAKDASGVESIASNVDSKVF